MSLQTDIPSSFLPTQTNHLPNRRISVIFRSQLLKIHHFSQTKDISVLQKSCCILRCNSGSRCFQSCICSRNAGRNSPENIHFCFLRLKFRNPFHAEHIGNLMCICHYRCSPMRQSQRSETRRTGHGAFYMHMNINQPRDHITPLRIIDGNAFGINTRINRKDGIKTAVLYSCIPEFKTLTESLVDIDISYNIIRGHSSCSFSY